MQIENDHALAVISRHDSPETLFYCDPPYPHESRGDSKAYGYEMSDDEHRRLADLLHSVKAKAALKQRYRAIRADCRMTCIGTGNGTRPRPRSAIQ